MLTFSRLTFNAALVGAITAFSASALGAEVVKFQASGPSMSATFVRITPTVCADGSESVREESIFISAAQFRDKVDGQQVRTEAAFATIFALDGCTGAFSVGSGDFTGFDYSQASVQRAVHPDADPIAGAQPPALQGGHRPRRSAHESGSRETPS